MKTKIQSLFMALLLVFAVVPTSVLAQVDLETEATIMKNVEADIINLFIKYSYDVDDIEDYIANTKDEEVAKLMKEYGQRAEEALAEGDEEKLVQSVEYLLSTFDQIITAKYGAEGSRQLMDKYTQYRTKPDYTQYKIKPDMRGKEPGTFWLYPGDQMAFKELESTLVLTYLGSSQNPSQKPTQVACTEELKLCPDGVTYVGRDSSRNCAWNACPGEGIVVVADQGVCEQFSMTFSTPAVLNKPLPPDANYGFSPYTPRYKEEYKKLAAAFQADYDRAVAAGDEEAIKKLNKAFEEQLQALSKKYSIKTSDDVAYAYPEKEDSDAAYTYPYDFEDFPEDKEVAKLKEEFERKYAEAVAEGEEEKMAKLKEEYLRKFDKIVTKKYDADASRQPIIGKPGKQGMMTAPMRSETKTFCIVPGEVGYSIMLYEKKGDGVLVGYNAWKGENPSSYVAQGAGVGALQQANFIKNEGACQVEGNGAIPVGTRLNVEGESQYCDALTKKMMVQKQDGEQAENDYECLSNEQNNGQCVNSLNILQKIWKGITSIFGF